MDRSSGQGGFYWEHEMEENNGQTRAGDSGSPLFYVDADGTRDVIGVLSSGADNMNPAPTTGDETWADITRDSNKSWVLANALDSSVNGGHSGRWLAQHGKNADLWFGEVDYVGPCRKDVDDDCDGWFDRGAVIHDNCPYVANAEQEDANEDGIGDACQKCWWDPKNDEDGDGVCGDGPRRPLNAAVDNCPRIKNSAQDNCNIDSEVQRAKLRGISPVILGDVCDPVPCPKVVLEEGTVRYAKGTTYDPDYGSVVSGKVTIDSGFPYPIPSHVAHETVARPVDNGFLVTHARFCQNDGTKQFQCLTNTPGFRDSALTDFPSADREENSAASPWHRVTHSPNLGSRGMSLSLIHISEPTRPY